MEELRYARFIIRWELKRLKRKHQCADNLTFREVYMIISLRRSLGEIHRLLNAFS